MGKTSLYWYSTYTQQYQLVDLTEDYDWSQSFLYVYPDWIMFFSQNHSYDGIYIQKTTTHEFGHLLALMHPWDNDYEVNSEDSIMYQGYLPRTNLGSYDTSELSLKW